MTEDYQNENEDIDDFDEEDEGQEPTAPVRLTKWRREPKVTDLKSDYEAATGHRTTHISNVDRWLENLNVEGAAKPKKVEGRSAVQPKLIRKQAEWRYASLSEPFLSTEDVYNVDPVTYEDKPAAYQNQLILNNQFNTKINKVKFIDEYVRTAVDEGTVVVRVGWAYEEAERVVNEPIMRTLPVTEPKLANTLIANGQPPEVKVQVGTKKITKVVVIKNHPTVDIIDYRNFTLDPSCEGDVDKAKFGIYSFQTSYSELKERGIYKNLEFINFGDNNALNSPDHHERDNSDFNFKDKPRKKFIAHEYWGFYDIEGDGLLTPIVATWVGNTLIRLEKNPFPDQKLPFVVVQYLPKRKSVYGEPDGELLEDNQKIVGAVTRGMIDIMGRSANGQQGYRKDALDVVNRRRFNKGMDYEYNANIDPRLAFHMHTFPEIPRSAVEMLGIQQNDADSMTGVKAFSNGLSGDALGSTNDRARTALDAASKRELGILRRLADGIVQIGRKFISMNGEFLSDEEVVRVTNEEFIPVKRDDLAGNFDLKLSISTAEADNEKASEISFMLQTLGPNTDFGFTKLLWEDLAKLRKMPALAKKISEFEPQPDPLVQQKAQLEVELLKAQIYNEQMKAIENAADVDLKRAKTTSERAKARQTNSNADKTDLDYVEQSTGVTRQHEMDKLDAQRRAKLDEKAADALLSERQNKEKGYKSVPL